jgi:predicted ester cyclase
MDARSRVLSVVKDYMAGWNAHDAARAARSLDADVEYYDATLGVSQHGIPAARDNVIAFFLDALPDLTWTMVDEPLVEDGCAAFRWVFTGTNTGTAFEGDAPTGARIQLHGMTFVKTRKDKIVYQGDFYDALTLRTQLGLTG